MNIFKDITEFILSDRDTMCRPFCDKEYKQFNDVLNVLRDSGYNVIVNRITDHLTIKKPVTPTYDNFRTLLQSFMVCDATTKAFAVIGTETKLDNLISIVETEFGLRAHVEYYDGCLPTLVVSKQFKKTEKKYNHTPGQLLNHISEPEEQFIEDVYSVLKKHFDYVPLKTALNVSADLWNELRKDLLIVKR